MYSGTRENIPVSKINPKSNSMLCFGGINCVKYALILDTKLYVMIIIYNELINITMDGGRFIRQVISFPYCASGFLHCSSYKLIPTSHWPNIIHLYTFSGHQMRTSNIFKRTHERVVLKRGLKSNKI